MTNYVDQFQTQSKEDAQKSIFDALSTKALNALNDVNKSALNTTDLETD